MNFHIWSRKTTWFFLQVNEMWKKPYATVKITSKINDIITCLVSLLPFDPVYCKQGKIGHFRPLQECMQWWLSHKRLSCLQFYPPDKLWLSTHCFRFCTRISEKKVTIIARLLFKISNTRFLGRADEDHLTETDVRHVLQALTDAGPHFSKTISFSRNLSSRQFSKHKPYYMH